MGTESAERRRKKKERVHASNSFLCQHTRCHATSFPVFSAPGHTTSPCINGSRDLIFYSITLMFTLSREIILNIVMQKFQYFPY